MARQEMFGEIAVRKGYIKPPQLDHVLRRQRTDQEGGKSHKLIGMLLLEAGALTNAQLIDVLREMERQRAVAPA